jgi:TetR/AcrR family transcriptional regulator, tetracycline repressor protein
MTKLSKQAIVSEALDLLDEVGLDAISTRQLSKRLRVEQPSLYWHFSNKEELLSAMADAAMAPHAAAPLPTRSDDWRVWFCENTRSFRRTLLMRRDGARLHAGTRPGFTDMERILRKLEFLIAAGVPENDARMGMLAASRYTVGSVLEEQAEAGKHEVAGMPRVNHEAAFEAGLALIVDGLAGRCKRRG